MQPLSKLIEEIKQEVEQSPSERTPKYEFEQLGKEMMQKFGPNYRKQIWPLFYNRRYSVPMIREAWFTYLKNEKHSFKYFVGILNNMTKK